MHEETNMLITTHADKRWPGSDSEYSVVLYTHRVLLYREGQAGRPKIRKSRQKTKPEATS